MKHSEIAALAMATACKASAMPQDTADLNAPPDRDLYDYARARKFPSPETLARHHYSTTGKDFPFASLDAAPDDCRRFYVTFHAVALALEPFYEPDPEPTAEPKEPAVSDTKKTKHALADADAAGKKHKK